MGGKRFLFKLRLKSFLPPAATDFYSIPIDLFDEQEDANLIVEVYYDQKPKYYSFANETQKLTEAEIMEMVQAEYFDEK